MKNVEVYLAKNVIYNQKFMKNSSNSIVLGINDISNNFDKESYEYQIIETVKQSYQVQKIRSFMQLKSKEHYLDSGFSDSTNSFNNDSNITKQLESSPKLQYGNISNKTLAGLGIALGEFVFLVLVIVGIF